MRHGDRRDRRGRRGCRDSRGALQQIRPCPSRFTRDIAAARQPDRRGQCESDRRAQPEPAPQGGSAPPADRVAFRGVRKVIAERMHQSLHSSAQITITAEADVTPATEFRTRLSREFDFSYTDMMIHSVAHALMHHPRMNARLSENGAEIALSASA